MVTAARHSVKSKMAGNATKALVVVMTFDKRSAVTVKTWTTSTQTIGNNVMIKMSTLEMVAIITVLLKMEWPALVETLPGTTPALKTEVTAETSESCLATTETPETEMDDLALARSKMATIECQAKLSLIFDMKLEEMVITMDTLIEMTEI